MFGRRSYARFSLAPSGAGVLRVLRDVIVQDVGRDEWLVVGREPAAVGDAMTLQLTEFDADSSVSVQVLESRPILVDGAIRHRLRLQRTASDSRGPEK